MFQCISDDVDGVNLNLCLHFGLDAALTALILISLFDCGREEIPVSFNISIL